MTTNSDHDIVCRGVVRGGPNASARVHLHLKPADAAGESLAALMSPLSEELGLAGEEWGGWHLAINSRREFALVPIIITRALRFGWRVSISLWDVGPKAQVRLDADPAVFWRELALAQMWYRDK